MYLEKKYYNESDYRRGRIHMAVATSTHQEHSVPELEFLYGKMESLQKVQEWMERGGNKI